MAAQIQVSTELWSLVAPNAVEIASYKNSFRVAS